MSFQTIDRGAWLSVFVLTVISCVFFHARVWAQNKVDLVYYFQPGAVFHITVMKNKKTQSEDQYGPSEQHSAALSRRTFKVLSVDEKGTATLEMRLDFVETASPLPGGSLVKVDTRSDQDFTPAEKQLLLSPVTLTVDRKGHVLRIEEIDEKVLDAFYSDLKSAKSGGTMFLDFLVSSLFSEQGIRQLLLETAFPEYPDAPVSVGDTWSVSKEIDIENAKAQVLLHYTLESCDNRTGQCRVGFNYRMNAYEWLDPWSEVEWDLASSKADGYYRINAATGFVHSAELTMNDHYDILLKYPNQPIEGLTRTLLRHVVVESGDALAHLPPLSNPDPLANVNQMDFETLLKRASQALRQSQYQRAERLLLAAQKKQPANLPLRKRMEVLLGQGIAAIELGNYEQGETSLKQVLEMLGQKPDPDGEDVVYSLLARLYHGQKSYEKAEAAYQKVLVLRRRGKEEHPQRFRTLGNYARLKNDMGQYPEAETLIREALGQAKTKLGETHPDTVHLEGDRAEVLYKQKKYEAATQLLLAVLSSQKSNLEPNHPELAVTMKRLAMVYLAQDQTGEARPYVTESIRILEKEINHLERYASDDISDIQKCRDNLTELYRLKKQLADIPLQ